MPTLHLFFSHALTPEQVADAQAHWGVNAFLALPQDLQKIFSNVPADIPTLDDYLFPLKTYLTQHLQPQDLVLIQGDFGVVVALVNFCKESNAIPIYATTERQSVEMPQPDGSIKTERIFKHKIFRRY